MFGNGVMAVLDRSEDFRDDNWTRFLNQAMVVHSFLEARGSCSCITHAGGEIYGDFLLGGESASLSAVLQVETVTVKP